VHNRENRQFAASVEFRGISNIADLQQETHYATMSVILTTLLIPLIEVDSVEACELLNRSLCSRCVSRCCEPTDDCLPTVCGPARAANNQAVEAVEPSLTEPADTVPAAVVAPAVPTTPQAEETPGETPAEQPVTSSEQPVAMPEQPATADEPAVAKPDTGAPEKTGW